MTVLWRTTPPMLRRLGHVRAVLFDRDDTLILDSPRFHADPTRVRPVPGAPEAVARLRAAGYPMGVVSGQAALGRSRLSLEQVQSVNRRVEQLMGPMNTWRYCPHSALDACQCREPGPQLVLQASADLGVRPEHIVVIGDVGADVQAARVAGAVGILVPALRTQPAEIRETPLVAPNLSRAVDMILAARLAKVPQ